MVKATNILSVEVLHTLFEYRDDGRIFWKVRTGGASKPGKEAGRPHHSGYRQVNIYGKAYMVHRIVFAMHRGFWPEQVDHINRDRSDCRIENLREATNSLNQANRTKTARSSTGYKGVTPHKKKWKAQIRKDYKLYYLGVFDSPQEAHAAYCEASSNLFGDFSHG